MLAVFAAASFALPAQVFACTPLQRAALEDDRATTQRLAGRRMLGIGPPKAELEVRTDQPGPCFRRTPLMLAAEYGSVASAQILITSGASLDAVALLPELGDAAIDARCLAIANGHQPLVALLEATGAQTAACTDNALLFAALAAGRTELVERQLRAHPSAATLQAALLSAIGKRRGNATNLIISAAMQEKADLQPVFAAAVTAGDPEMLKLLVGAGARVRGGAELVQVLASNQAGLVETLVAGGARADNAEVRAALVDAIRDRKSAALLALVATGYRGDADVPILTEAIAWMPGVVPRLVTAGVGVEVDDVHGTTPLMAAASAGDGALVDLLLERGASIRAGNLECLTMHDLLAPALRAAHPEWKAPANVVPGRAARLRGVTCGDATLNLTFPDGFEVFLAGGQLPIRSGSSYRLDPGSTELRVVPKAGGPERKLTVKLRAGMNAFVESFDPNRPLPALEAPPLVELKPAAAALELHEVLAVVGAKKAEVAKCRRLAGEAALGEGPLVMTFRVSPEGAAVGIEHVPTGAARTQYARCLKEKISAWKFPAGRTTKEPFLIPFN